MKLLINGKEKIINAENITIQQILQICEVQSPDMVSVQFNRKFIRKDDYSKVFPKESDEIDFLYFMGGGKYL